MEIIIGIDVGGTTSAVCVGVPTLSAVKIIKKRGFSTPQDPYIAIQKYIDTVAELLRENQYILKSIGISCGGPLDSERGLILSPPNLPEWDNLDIITPFKKKFKVPVSVQNDADACAIAEWKWGNGKGFNNIVFLTFGTGMGAGLILNGKLYSGTNNMAGEVGHIRLENDGPLDYGKKGTFSGFCSGGSIPRLAKEMIEKKIKNGDPPSFCSSLSEVEHVTTKIIGNAAQAGDLLALEIFEIVGRKLGKGISILIDILNPQRIIIGSIYVRQQNILEPFMREELREETLQNSLDVCEVVPSLLGESIGDYASLGVALANLESTS